MVMFQKAISSLLILTLVSSNSAMAISKDQQEADLTTPIEFVEYVRDDSIPVSYALCENPCSYEKLADITAGENITQVLPGDVLCYDKELLWDCNIPDMVEAGELTKYQDTIIISYVSAENYVTTTYYPNGDYEMYAKPLGVPEEETILQVWERKGGVIDNYSLRREVTAVRNHTDAATSMKILLCILPTFAVFLFCRRTSMK